MKSNILKAHKKMRHPTKLPENLYQRPSSQARPFEVPIFSDEHARLLLIHWQQNDIIKGKIKHLIFVWIYFLDAQASLAPTHVSWVGHSFLFPFCQHPWALAKRRDEIEMTDMVADTVADMVADKVADMVADKVVDMEVDMVADMVVDKVAEMVAEMEADMLADKKEEEKVTDLELDMVPDMVVDI